MDRHRGIFFWRKARTMKITIVNDMGHTTHVIEGARVECQFEGDPTRYFMGVSSDGAQVWVSPPVKNYIAVGVDGQEVVPAWWRKFCVAITAEPGPEADDCVLWGKHKAHGGVLLKIMGGTCVECRRAMVQREREGWEELAIRQNVAKK